MSQQEANEQARRNYALEAYTMGEEFFLKIFCGGEIWVTVCAPEGPTPPSQFNVYNKDGLDEDDVEDPALLVKAFKVQGSIGDTWREAVHHAYRHALAKMMTTDQREERFDQAIAA